MHLPDTPPTSERSNWSGNLHYSATNTAAPATVAEVQAAVRSAGTLRALGTRHAFNAIADNPGLHIETRRLCDIEIDTAKKTARVGAGARYGDLALALEGKGLALHNLASLPHISVGGAVATSTHGSGLGNGNLATAVLGLELVDGTGERRTLTPADLDFAGAVVGLGSLGIVTHLTLRLEPTYRMVQHVFERLPFSVLERDFEAVMSAGYSVSLFTDWQRSEVRQVWIKRRVDPGQDRVPADPTFFGATLATAPLHPLPESSAEACTEQSDRPGAWFDRLPHFRLDFQPSHGEELQTEYFVPFEQAYEAVRAVEQLRDTLAPVLFISELRAVAADELWLSGQFRRRSLGLHFTWRRQPEAVLAILPQLEAALAPFAARPHWGKVFTTPPQRLRQLYPQIEAFSALRQRFDPAGKLRNAFTDTLLG